MLSAFQLSEDARGGKANAGYLEARAKDRKGRMTDAALSELRNGWYPVEKSFGERILESIRIPLGGLGLPGTPSERTGRGKRKDETELVAAPVRKRTAMPNRWLASRLGMGHEVAGTRAVRCFRDSPELTARLNALEKRVAQT